MRTIALVTQKGGSGKSTIAASLAIAAYEAGEKVFVVDMDPQGSLLQWFKARKNKDVAVEAIKPGRLNMALKAMEKGGISLVIIDTPGTESHAAEQAMKAAQLSIIPARPNAFDLWASENTRKTLRGLRKDYTFLLNQCPPAQQSARVEQGAKALQAMGGLLTPLISARVDYQDAARMGKGVTEIASSGEAADEMRKLWRNIKRRMAQGKPKPAAKPSKTRAAAPARQTRKAA